MTNSSDSGRDILRERPFYFMINFWGEEFRSLFLNYCLASLLSPRNIPALVNKESSRFIIVAPRADLEALDRAPMIAELRKHIATEFIEVSDPNAVPKQRRSANFNYEMNAHGYKLAADYAFRNKGYGCYLCPDTMLSDGTVVRLQERARKGAKAVMVAALRHEQVGMLRALESVISCGKPICLAPRDLMRLALAHLHPQVLRHDWTSDNFSTQPGFSVWRVPGGDGIILHSMRCNPLLISYADLTEHRTDSRFGGPDRIAMDDDYIFNNFGAGEGVQIVTDTDEIAYVSFTPSETAVPLDTTGGEMSKRICLRVSAQTGMLDPLQRRLFRTHGRFHSGDITPEWSAMEQQIDAILDATLAAPPSAFDRLWQRYAARGVRRLLASVWQRLAGGVGLKAARQN
jgi:hypothetical protein